MPQRLARAPNLADAFEPKRTLGGFGEVEFAAGHIWPAIHDRNAHLVPAIAQRHERATGKRLVGHSHRGACELAATGKTAATPIPGGPGDPVGTQVSEPASCPEIPRIADEQHPH